MKFWLTSDITCMCFSHLSISMDNYTSMFSYGQVRSDGLRRYLA
jgi:hypothetical protein